MPLHDDDHIVRIFNDTYAVLMERAPVAPAFEEITTSLIDPSRDAPLLDHSRGQVDTGPFSDRCDESIDQSADAEVLDLTVDYLRQRPDESDEPSERKGRNRAVIAVAAAILVVTAAANRTTVP